MLEREVPEVPYERRHWQGVLDRLWAEVYDEDPESQGLAILNNASVHLHSPGFMVELRGGDDTISTTWNLFNPDTKAAAACAAGGEDVLF